MIKIKLFKATALLICVIFICCVVSFASAEEKKIAKTNCQTVTKNSIRILGFIFPMLNVFTVKSQNNAADKRQIIDDNNMSLILMPAVEASSNTPKTKD